MMPRSSDEKYLVALCVSYGHVRGVIETIEITIRTMYEEEYAYECNSREHVKVIVIRNKHKKFMGEIKS